MYLFCYSYLYLFVYTFILALISLFVSIYVYAQKENIAIIYRFILLFIYIDH